MKPILLLAALAASSLAMAQKFSDLRLTARAEKAALVPGEPLTIAVEAANASSQPISAHRDLSPGYGLLSLEFGGSAYRGPGWGKDSIRPAEAKLAPGEKLLAEVVIANGFEKPGTYRITVRWSSLGFEESVETTVEVEVKDATGPDAAAHAALEKDPTLESFIAHGELNEGESQKAAAFLAAHPQSAYAPHLALALGRHHVEAKDGTKAHPHLEAAMKATGTRLRREAILLQVQAHMLQKQESEAVKLLRDSAEEFKNTPQHMLHERMLKELSG